MTNGRGLTLPQLRAYISAAIAVPPERVGVVGIRTAECWAGGPTIDHEGRVYTVVRAASPLAVREAVENAAGREPSLVVLTPLEPAELGQDLLARFCGGRLLSVDLWESVRGLFGARQIDPTVRSRAVAQALLEHAPPAGYPPVPAGVLDAGTVWRCLTRHVFGMGDREPDLAGLLRWASGPNVARYSSAPEDLRNAFRRRLTETLGAAADSVFSMIDSGAAADSLPLAIVFGIVFESGLILPELREAAARLERFHNNVPIPPGVGEQLARAAGDALRECARDGADGGGHYRDRADRLLLEVRAEAHAHRSPLTQLGFDQRLERLAIALRNATDESGRGARGEPVGGSPPESGRREPGGGSSPESGNGARKEPRGGPPPETDEWAADAIRACEDALRAVAAHALAEHHPVRVEQARMAVRLVRWTTTSASVPRRLDALAAWYRDDGAFVDWGRDALAGGDAIQAVTAAYRAVEGMVRRRRGVQNYEFARCLQESLHTHVPAGLLPVEGVLDRVLVPLVKAGHRVLLLVLDGMSWAVGQEVLAGIRATQWREVTFSTAGEPPPPLLAAIPSVTEQSRASLLAGRRCHGDSAQEKRAFAEHTGLAAVCTRKHPPRLFHKGELTDGGRGGLSDAVSDAVLGDHRVVGVVINAIDDRLATAQQVRDRWGIETIRPLGALLQTSRAVGRVIVVASDHGHVWHRDDGVYRSASESGERWRPADGVPGADEILLKGPRVRGPGDEQQVIVPWDEQLRYGPSRNGYHGGATPQEMLAPLILLAPPGVTPKGLSLCRLPTPAWWDEAPSPVEPTLEPPRGKPVPAPPADVLFDPNPVELDEAPAPALPPAPTSAIDRLLASAVYATQKEAVGKHPPDDATVRRCLESLERHGGTLTPAALAQQAGVLPLRLDGLLAKLQRLLNVDGYEVLQVDRSANRVSLNAQLLCRQFEVG